MILAAGLGTRMAPITRRMPKPLVPLLNVPNVVHNIWLLKRAGIRELILNTFHLPGQIEQALGDGKRLGLAIKYSRETVLLGTGGGVKQAEWFFGNDPFVLCNCDFVTNADLNPFLDEHARSGAWASMLLVEDPERQRLYSKVGISEDGQLCLLPGCETGKPARTGIFTGIHALDPRALKFLSPEPSGINQVLYPHLMRETPRLARARFLEGAYWLDTGEVPTFWESSMRLLDKLETDEGASLRELLSHYGYRRREAGIWALEGVKVPASAKLRAPALLGMTRIEGSCELGPHLVAGDGSAFGANCRAEKAVVLPGALVADGEQRERGIADTSGWLDAEKKSKVTAG